MNIQQNTQVKENILEESITLTKESHRDFLLNRMIPPTGNKPVKANLSAEVATWIQNQ